MIFLTKFLRSTKAKHFILLICFGFLMNIVFGQTGTGVVNNGAKIIINTGAVMKITGSGADYTNNSSGSINGRIDLDGKIEIEGDWINSSTGDVMEGTNNNGLVLFNGSSLQTISGSTTLFENLEIDNTAGLSLGSDINVKYNLSLTNGLVTLNTSNVYIGTGGTLSGTFGASKMFVINNSGSLRKLMSTSGSFLFPIGEITGTAEYSPVNLTLNSSSGFESAWIGAHVTDAIHPNNTSPDEYITRYWTLSSSGLSSPNYNADFYYQQADVYIGSSTEDKIYSAEYDGASRTVFSPVNYTNNILSVSGLSSFADYTGVDGTVPTVSVTSPDDPGPTNSANIPFVVSFSEVVTGFVEGDISIDNGTISNFVSTANPSFTFDITPDKDSTVTVNIASAVAKDIAGNDNSASNIYRIVSDRTAPEVEINSTKPNPTNSSFTVSIYFNEEVLEFTSDDVTVNNGTKGTFTSMGDRQNWTLIVNPTTDGIVTVDIAAAAAQDLAGNDNIAATQFSITYDDNSPSVLITSTETNDPTNLAKIPITITFNEVVTGFALNDISVGNGSAGNLQNTTTGQVWTAEITPSSDGTITVDIAAGAAKDLATNLSTAAPTFSIDSDRTPPGVVISSGESDPTNNDPFTISIAFSESVTGFDETDVSVTGNCTKGTVTGSGQNYSLSLDPTADGLIEVNVSSSVAIDDAGNGNTVADTYSITYDGSAPTVNTLYPEDDGTGVLLTDNLQMTFNENVFEGTGSVEIRLASDNSLFQSIAVSSLSGYGSKTITIAHNDFTSEIEYYVLVPAGTFKDEAGNDYAGITTAGNWSFITVDTNVPVISSKYPEDEAENVPISDDLVLTFSENVDAVSGKYIKIVNETTLAEETIEASNASIVTVNANSVTINPSDFDGETTYHVLIDAGAFEDIDNNPFGGISSTTYWNFTTADIANPMTTAFSPIDDQENVVVDANLQITFNEEINAVSDKYIHIVNETTTDVESIESTVATITSGNIVTVNPTDFDGETAYHVLIDAGAFEDLSGNPYGGIVSTSDWNFVTEDITAPTVEIDPVAGPINAPFQVIITFNEVMTDFELGDISVTNGNASNLNSASNPIFTADISPDLEGEVFVIIPAGVATDASGNGNEVSNEISVMYDSTSPSVEITSLAADPTASDFDITVTFSEGIIDLVAGNITVDNGTVSGGITNSSDGTVWDATISPSSDGTVTVYIAADELVDSAGNGNELSNTFTIEYDGSGPQYTGLIPNHLAENVLFNSDLQITFDENVTLNTGYDVHIIKSGVGEVETIDAGDLTVDGNTVTINPSDFDSEATYSVEIDAQAFIDDLGNGFVGLTSGEWEFTVEDIIAPTAISYSPDEVYDVPVDANLEITFSEEIDKNVGSIIIWNAETGVEHEIINVAGSQVTVSGDVASIDPSVLFIGSTNYYVTVGESTFQDLSVNSNNYAGFISNTEWTFTTIDAEPPVVVEGGLSPADGSMDVGITSNLVLTFNEDVTEGDGNIVIYNESGIHETIHIGSGNVSISGNQITINPTYDFNGYTNYYVLIDATAIDDLFGNSYAGIANPEDWNFTTGSGSAPYVDIYSPANNETGVGSDVNLVLTFNEDVLANDGNIIITNATTSTEHETISVNSGNVSVSGSEVTINSSIDFIDMNQYYVQIDYGAFLDLEGYSYAGIADNVTWNFTVGDNTAPTIISGGLTPADNATDIAITTNLEMVFTETVEANTGYVTIMNTAGVYDEIDVTTGSISISGSTVTITPTKDLEGNDSYHVLVDATAFTDIAGNTFEGISGSNTWNFQTTDILNPTITSLVPENNATGVAVDANLVITFSENVIPNAGLITIMNGTNLHESIDVLSNQVDVSDNVVTIDPASSFEGEMNYHILIANDAFHDQAGNGFAGIDNEATWTFTTEDITQPTVTITSTASGTVNDNFDVVITFSETVTGFTSEDVDVINGSIINFTQTTTNQVWTVTIDPIADGEVTVDVGGGVAQDAAGNNNTAAIQFSVVYDSGVGFEDIIPYEISIYSFENKVIVEFENMNNHQFEKGKIEIYNLLGQKIVESELNNFVKFETEVEHVSQIYVVKLTIDDSEYSKRLYIE